MGNSKSQGATKRACGGTRKPREGTDLDELERRSKPLLEFLEANHNPNCMALVGREGATILEAVAFVPAQGHTHGEGPDFAGQTQTKTEVSISMENKPENRAANCTDDTEAAIVKHAKALRDLLIKKYGFGSQMTITALKLKVDRNESVHMFDTPLDAFTFRD